MCKCQYCCSEQMSELKPVVTYKWEQQFCDCENGQWGWWQSMNIYHWRNKIKADQKSHMSIWECSEQQTEEQKVLSRCLCSEAVEEEREADSQLWALDHWDEWEQIKDEVN